MAEGVLFDVAARIIEKTGKLAGQEIGLLKGLKDEIVKLGERVSTIKAVLLDAENIEEPSIEVKEWLKRLRDAIYGADDLVDDISTEALRWEVMTRNKKAEQVRALFSKSKQLAYGLKMGHKVKGMRDRLDVIAGDMEFFQFEKLLVETQDRNRVREHTVSLERAEIIVEREEDKKVLVDLLLYSNVEENVSVVSIVGIGGLGKTTFARYVFNDEVIKKHFEQRLWVCVSDDFDIKVIVMKILEFIRKGEQQNLEMKTLVNDLQVEIDAKRYLLVLDDVWNEDYVKWSNFETLLMSGARGSKILVTTRSTKIASTVSTSPIYIYHLLSLSLEGSLELLRHMAYKNCQEPVDLRMMKIERKLVNYCQGVPLLIKTIGGLLYFKKLTGELVELSYFVKKVKKVSLLEDNNYSSLLILSYDHLPSYLKQCFAYCCLFPKDYKFHKPTLIRMWIAQEFIRSTSQNLEDLTSQNLEDLTSQNLEDLGHDYFMELLLRSFFQDVEKDDRGNILYFKIHDLMHDIAIRAARSDSVIIYSNEIFNENILHVSFDGWVHSLPKVPISLFKASKIRTFLLPSQSNDPSTRLDMSDYIAIITSFKHIRMLDLHNLGIKSVPSAIGKLKHLRYLDLSYNEYIEVLPNSFTGLLNLQTLKLTACTRLKEFPRDINKLVNLTYLEISGCVLLDDKSHGLEQLTNCHIVQQSMVGKDLRLNLLIEVYHGKDATLESKAANLKERMHLQTLGLRWIEEEVEEGGVVYDEMSLNQLQPYPNLKVLSLYRYWGVSFPSWLLSLTNLVKFALYGCKKCQHLPPMDQFPSLKVLELDSLLALEYIAEAENNEEISNSSLLPSLEELKLKYCPNLKGWWRRRNSIEEHNGDDDNSVGIITSTTLITKNHLLPSIPQLSKLCIRGCPKLTSMPSFPCVEKLELYYCSFKPLEQTAQIAVQTIGSTSSSYSKLANSPFAPLSILTSLEIGRMKEPLPKECLQKLISLDHLLIYECCGPLLQGIRHLTALKKLDICSSEVFDLPNNENKKEWEGLRSLNSLCLFQLPDLESPPKGLQHVKTLKSLMLDYCPSLNVIPGWISYLTSLQSLEILQCPKLKSLPVEICGLTSLQTLKVSKCPNFTSLPKEMGGLASLQVLRISEFTNLTSLPEGMRGLISLQTLDISKWHNLTSLPEWMGGLASLKTLYISECPNLTSLPEGMRGLSSLQTLCIEDCPILLKRCKKGIGEDWPKIAHIPNLLGDRQGRLLGEEPNEAQEKPAHKNRCLFKAFGCCNS